MTETATRRPTLFAPSILTADFGRLADAVHDAEDGGAGLMHLDVMDGHFVPQITFGPPVVEAVRKATHLPIEVHMMVPDPVDQLDALADAGADSLIFHLEATSEPKSVLEHARAVGCASGIAISPDTPVTAVEPLLELLDEVVVMTVYPGRGGQTMLEEHLDKVKQLRQWIDNSGLDIAVEVDGGVKPEKVAKCVEAGAQILVVGSAVYNEHETPQGALATLRSALAATDSS